MTSSFTFTLSVACLLLTAAIPSGAAQQSVRSDPESSQTVPTKQKPALLDFALHGINPNDRDYGACLDDARRIFVQQTFERAYFWSDVLAIGVAIGLFGVVVHQHRLLQRREAMAADTLTQYRNALARAEIQANEATRRNHDFMHALSASPVRTAPNGAEFGEHTERGKPRKVAAAVPSNTVPTAPTLVTPTSSAKTTKDRTIQPATQEPRPANQMGLFGSDGDFVAKINSLQQQLNTSQERERQLRRQLNDSELRVEKERQKSRNLQA